MPTNETPEPSKVTTEPVKPAGVELTERQKTTQYMVRQIFGMSQSEWHVIQFKNSPLSWMQYFAGLALKMPTIIVMQRSDAEWIPSLKHPLVKAFFQVNSFTGPEADHVATKITKFVKQHPHKSK